MKNKGDTATRLTIRTSKTIPCHCSEEDKQNCDELDVHCKRVSRPAPITDIESTLGRFIFNEILPQDLGFVDRSKPENLLEAGS